MNDNNRLASDLSPDLGLDQFPQEPFDDTDSPEFFYPEHTRIQRLRLLLHLTSLDEILLIIGQPGAGKTMLLKQFLLQAKENASVNLIDVYDIKNEIQFLTSIAEVLGLDLTQKEPEQPLKHQILDAIKDLQQTKLRTILAIDNAHKLNIECLQCIEAIVRHTQQHSKPLHIVIAGDTEIQKTLEHPDLKALKQSILHTFEIPPFDEHQTKEYILHRLHAANYHNHALFTPAIIKKIYKQSEGLPERINTLARQTINSQEELALFAFETTTEESQEEKPALAFVQKIKNMWNTKKLIPVILIASVIAFIFILQSIISNHFTDETTTQHTETLILPTIDKTTQQPIATNKITENLNNPYSATSQIPPNTNQQTTPEPTATETPQHPKEAEPEIIQEIVNVPTPTSKAPITTVKQTKAVPVQAEKQTTKTPAIKNKEWVNKQNAEHYTLQIFAVSKKEAMLDFIQDNQLMEQSTYLGFERNGTNLYVMFYGSYENRDLASKAINNLPVSLASFKPWIRSYGSIQEAIKNNQ